MLADYIGRTDRVERHARDHMVLVRRVRCDDYCRPFDLFYDIVIVGYAVFLGVLGLEIGARQCIKDWVDLAYFAFVFLFLVFVFIHNASQSVIIGDGRLWILYHFLVGVVNTFLLLTVSQVWFYYTMGDGAENGMLLASRFLKKVNWSQNLDRFILQRIQLK